MILAFVFFGLTGLWAVAAYVGVSIGLAYLGGVLFGQDLKEAEDEPKGQSFAWEPHTTFQEGIPKPICFGHNLHYGNMIMKWTDVDPISGNEVLYKALDYGQGPIRGVEGEVISDVNHCLGGTPDFNLLLDQYIDTWWDTAANANDNDKTTYVGFTGTEPEGHNVKGRFDSIVEFASATIDRITYRRHWYIKGDTTHVGYEKIYLWYAADWHLIATKNMTTEGDDTGTVVIEASGPWEGVTKIKIEVELSAVEFWFRTWRDSATVTYKLYELRAWHLEDVPVFLNGQPAHNFTEAIIRGRPGTLDQTCMKDFEKNKLQSAPETTIVYGEPVSWTTPNKFADDIEFTLAWLRGLYFYSSDGKVKTHSVGVKVEVSERGEDDWATVLDTSVSGNQLNQLYKAYSVNTLVPATVVYGTQYDVRFSKTTEDKSQSRYGDEVQVRSVREVVDVAFTHPGRALLGVIVEATERLQGHVDVTWETDDKLVQVYNSETKVWDIEFSRNRAYIDLAIRTQPVISGDGDVNPWTVERYEGLSPDSIDLNKWYEWAQFCDDLVPSGIGEETEKRIPCDIICDQVTSVWSIAYEIAQIGRMYPYWQGVTLTGWIDKATTEEIDLITMDNTMARSWKNSYGGYGEMAGSLEIFYKDSQQGYARKPRPVHNANAGLYTRVIKLEGVGVNSESLATRVGNHALKRNELIKNVNSVRMGREALRYKLGRVVLIQCNVPDWGQAFRVITSPTNATVELDRVIADVVENDLLWVKTAHSATSVIGLDSYTVDSVAGKVVTIKETWVAGRTPLRDHMAAIGIVGSMKYRRIIKTRAVAENYFDIELETYDTDLFLSDGVDPVLTNPDYLQPVTETVQPITRQMITDLISELAPTAPKVTKPQLYNCKWVGNDVDTVEWAKRNPDEPILLEWAGTTHEITPNSTTLEYIYWDSESPTVFLATNSASTALAAGMYLACTNKNGVEQPADMAQMSHGAIIQVGTLIAAQIIIGGINALGLLNAPAEAGADVTGGHQGDINIDNITDGTTYKKFTSTEDTKLIGIETSADVTANHADDVIYRGNTPPTHKAGRVWYCLVNGSYANYTLYKSTGTVWQKIGDETAQHQADIQLANLGEKSVDSLTDGSVYARMLKAWRHTSDPTKLDLSLGFAASITTAQIGLLAVHTGQIDNLAVETLKIANEAVTLMVAAFTAGQLYYEDYSWHTAQTLNITTTGAPVMLLAAVQWKNVGDYGFNIRIQRDNSVTIYSTNMATIGQLGNPFCVAIVDEPDSGEHDYDLDVATTNVDIGDPKIWYKNRSLVAKEVKK